jgi:hypothetical protein
MPEGPQKRIHFYSIQPKANYKIWGFVVATHDSSSWMDITHQRAGDFFNTHDICLIWGDNARSQYLKQLSIRMVIGLVMFKPTVSNSGKHFVAISFRTITLEKRA